MKFPIKYFCLALCLFLLNCSKTIKGNLVITNVNIIDVKTGTIDFAMDVVINSDKITSILKHKSNTKYQAETVVDGSEKFLIPGLWDMHTHTWWAYEDFFPLLIANGITGIREMFGDLKAVKKIREEIGSGKIVGPMIVSSGPIVDGNPPAWSGSDVADSPESGREIVRQQKADGADYIKVYSLLERDVYFAIADECKKQGITFSGHIPRVITLEEAVASGQNSTEHFDGILEFMSSKFDYYYDVRRGKKKDSLLNTWIERLAFVTNTFNKNKIDSLNILLSSANFWVDPTSVVNRSFAYINDSEFREDDRLKYMPDYTTYNWDPKKDSRLSYRTDADYDVERNWYNLGLSIMKSMLDGGAKFLAGTDYPNPYTFPGFSLHDELEIYVTDAGFTPLEALQTATINPAIFLKKESELGTVETGKLANLVLLDKNPLVNINNTRHIHSVIVSGQYLEGEKLRGDLKAIANKNKLPKIYEVLKPIIEKQGIEKAITKYHQIKKEQPDAYNFDEEQLNTLGYELMESGKTLEAVKILELNIEVYPDYINGYDSLGDGYMSNGDKANALKIWEEAVAKGLSATKPKLDQLKKEIN